MTEKTELSIHRSFVVRLYDGGANVRTATDSTAVCAGVVEHVVSGSAVEFRSAGELLEFFREVLAATNEPDSTRRMEPMEIATLSGSPAVIDAAEIEELTSRMHGPLLRPGDPGYDAARVIFNGMFDRRPALIARCRGVADVVDAVSFARRHRLLTAVRGGGHNVAGNAMCDDGLVIDLSLMNGVFVDRHRRVARVAGGAIWADVDRETQAFGLATPGGVVSHTGVAGLTLGGGMGWLKNKYGLSCDNLVSAEIVTADGSVLTASENENEDLFWALRGGGGNFGVVTSFEFRLHELGPSVAAVFSMYPMAEARSVLAKWRDWVLSAPEEVSAEAVLWTMPAAPGLPPAVHERDVVIAAGVYAGDPAEGMRVLEALRQFGKPLGEILGPMPYKSVQTAFDAFFPNTGELISHWKSLYLDELGKKAIDIIAERAENRSTAKTMLWIEHLGRALRRVGPGETAFAARDAHFLMNFGGAWTDGGESSRHVTWVRDAWSRLAPHSTGAVYLNFLGREEKERESLVRTAYGANYERLVEVKRKYDPENLFRLNQNIEPRSPAELASTG